MKFMFIAVMQKKSNLILKYQMHEVTSLRHTEIRFFSYFTKSTKIKLGLSRNLIYVRKEVQMGFFSSFIPKSYQPQTDASTTFFKSQSDHL